MALNDILGNGPGEIRNDVAHDGYRHYLDQALELVGEMPLEDEVPTSVSGSEDANQVERKSKTATVKVQHPIHLGQRTSARLQEMEHRLGHRLSAGDILEFAVNALGEYIDGGQPVDSSFVNWIRCQREQLAGAES